MGNRIVITGAGGQVGSFLAATARLRRDDVAALTSADCDVTDPEQVTAVVRPGDVVVNCAAYTDVDGAESDEARAHAVNAVGAGNVAAACAGAGARLIHVSTDYVFSGVFGTVAAVAATPHPYETGDATGPLGAYGRTKLAGEQAVLAALPTAHVVRTSWVYTGGDGGDFVATMRRLAAGDASVDVVDDQIGSPTYVADLVAALLHIADGRVRGQVLHAANRGAVSRYEQARAVFEGVSADPARVRPVTSADAPRPAPRPHYSALSGRASMAVGLPPLRGWLAALSDALARAAK